ncbi:nucleotide disphospho-sugar-binding domain-containing protein, partial [Streptomyces sp. SID9124]|uniref:nucleotide disphospho-sugar-binding domain-containing protein n=2 Tax=Streptomyces TaxID=1883 RepID=UPI001400ADBA|nr:glycosyltransferase [Streptomyces sp. SID9124]
RAVRDAGAGEVVFAPDLTADAVTEAARGLLASESARVGARKVADEIASMPLPAETVKRLAEFAG